MTSSVILSNGRSPFENKDLNPLGLNPSNREARKDVPCENTEVGVTTSRNKISIFICLQTSTLNGKMTTEPKYSNLRFVLTSHYASYTLTVSIMYRQRRNIEVDLFENTEIFMRIQDSILF